MAVSTGVQTLSAEAVETLSASKHEPTWMRDRRLAAWQLSEELALPLGTEEEWRRTDLRGLELEHYLPLPPQVPAVQRREELSAFFVEHMTLPETPVGGLVVHQDGAALWQTLDDTLKSQGVIFCGLDTAVQQHAELVKATL